MITDGFKERGRAIEEALQTHAGQIVDVLGIPPQEAVVMRADTVDFPIASIIMFKHLGLADEPGKKKNSWRRELLPRITDARLIAGGAMGLNQDAEDRVLSFGFLTPFIGSFVFDGKPLLVFHVRAADSTKDTVYASQILLCRPSDLAEFTAAISEISQNLASKNCWLYTIESEDSVRSAEIPKYSWDRVVLSESAKTIFKDDFESFFARKEWFKDHDLPFRRGYLLHGPPGNGKTSAIKAMAYSQNMTVMTIDLFDRKISDADLSRLFKEAADRLPSIVLLEDIDRAFPRTSQERTSTISMQQLLNSIDGVSTQDGAVLVATANEPTLLDPAILKRPGRFDRTVHFDNPDAGLRAEYFLKKEPSLDRDTLDHVIQATSGFSFAQLQETYILAGQLCFANGTEITSERLLEGVESLKNGVILSKKKSTTAGF